VAGARHVEAELMGPTKVVTKPFDELTAEELVALTDEQRQYYVDRLCAEEGVRLLPAQAPVPPPQLGFEKDLTIYTVAGIGVFSREHADAIARAINTGRRVKLEYAPGLSYRDRYAVEDGDPAEVEESRAYSQHYYESRRALAHEHSEAMVAYEAAKVEYDRIVSARAAVSGRVLSAIAEAVREKAKRDAVHAEYNRYLELADFDVNIARRFLTSAYPDAQEIAPDLFSALEAPPSPRAMRTRGVPKEVPSESDIPF
jgi:hypothetical protein